MSKKKLIVTKDGIPCRLACREETGLGSDFSGRLGLLVKGTYENAKLFSSEEFASRLIMKTQDAQNKLRGTLVDGLPRLQPVLEGGGI